jgi:nuclear GTP-binding protein
LKAYKARGNATDAPQAEEDDELDSKDDEELYDHDSGSDAEEDSEMIDDSKNPMAALLASAKARAAEYEQPGGVDADAMDEDGEAEFDGFDDSAEYTTTLASKGDSSRRAFDKIFKQVIESADVILYVLDARDPEGTRSREVERQILAADGGNKRLILILNKIDLVPPSVLKGWLVHLRRYFPTLPLRASMPASNARTFDHKQLTVKGTSETLFKALKTYAQSKSLKRSISVGIIGYPNVGKSSVINALTTRLGKGATAPVGAEAGVTTSVREVKLDNKLKLLDSPGIVFPTASASKTDKTEEHARLILLNAVPPKDIDDPTPAVSLLLKRMSGSEDMMSNLLDVYDLPPLMNANGDVATDFLVQVARKRGRLGKGGIPNLHSAAQCVITDWRDGRIQGWVDPPVRQVAPEGADANMDGVDHVKVVKEWADEFKLEGLWGGTEETAMES